MDGSEYTMVLSGRSGMRQQALVALNNAGLALVPIPKTAPRAVRAHGMADTDEGTEDAGIDWLTVTGASVDTATAAVTPFGWRLRAHFLTPAPAAEDPLATLLRRVEALEKGKKA